MKEHLKPALRGDSLAPSIDFAATIQLLYIDEGRRLRIVYNDFETFDVLERRVLCVEKGEQRDLTAEAEQNLSTTTTGAGAAVAFASGQINSKAPSSSLLKHKIPEREDYDDESIKDNQSLHNYAEYLSLTQQINHQTLGIVKQFSMF
jgi:hypothetical protein